MQGVSSIKRREEHSGQMKLHATAWTHAAELDVLRKGMKPRVLGDEF